MDQNPHRLWRLRKLDHAVDAEIRPAPAGAFTVRFLYDGAETYTREWPTRADAFAECAAKRLELERSGWMAHW
jgi:hypothetical protein